jgi:hypothetical protein
LKGTLTTSCRRKGTTGADDSALYEKDIDTSIDYVHT